jgi:hypothetical protein
MLGGTTMAVYLKSVAALLGFLGILAGLRFTSLALHDEAFRRAALAQQRNAGNILFESEFRVSRAGHLFLVYSAAGSFVIALVGGSLLWGVGALHAKLDRRR